ncbi:MAG: hypothetical protein AAF199_08865, partial [Pseudomonadota bacterium]
MSRRLGKTNAQTDTQNRKTPCRFRIPYCPYTLARSSSPISIIHHCPPEPYFSGLLFKRQRLIFDLDNTLKAIDAQQVASLRESAVQQTDLSLLA